MFKNVIDMDPNGRSAKFKAKKPRISLSASDGFIVY